MANTLVEIWTALPNGFVKNSSLLRLSLLVTFRLKTDQNPPPDNLTLADFIQSWKENNWTKTVRDYGFTVDFGKGPRSVKPTNEFHPEMWDALFGNPKAVKVKPYFEPATGDDALSKAEVLTYDATNLNTRLETAYTKLANSKTRLRTAERRQMALASIAQDDLAALVDEVNIYAVANPTEKERQDSLTALRWLEEDTRSNAKALAYRDLYLQRISRNGGRDLRLQAVKDVHQKIKEKVPEIAGPGGVIFLIARPQASPQAAAAQPQPSPQPQSTGTVKTDFAIFHSAPPESVTPGCAPAAQTERVFDFHEMLTMVGNFPVLMRRLGLVIDVEIDPGAIDPEGVVRVTQAGTKGPHPKTAYKLDLASRKFLPKNSTPRIKDGLLDLSNGGHFSIQSVDSDGALMKHLANVSNARREDPAGSKNLFADVTDEQLKPTLRTLGISVLFTEFEVFLKELLVNAEAKSCQPTDCLFHAEDLVKGLRVDIQEVASNDVSAGSWYSLCERAEKYHFLTADNQELFQWPTSGAYASEGTLGLTVTKPEVQKSPGAADLKVLQQHQSLFRWDNWSLCVPFPQKPLDVKRCEVQPDKSPLRLRSEFEVVNKSLPKLRFGRQYRVRCRVVDPAGNSLGKDDVGEKDYSATIGPQSFARYEAVAPPLLLVTSEIKPEKTPGDQLNRLVLRDGEGSTRRCAAPSRVTAMTAIMAGEYDKGVAPADSAFVGAQLDDKGEFPQADSDDPAYRTPVFLFQPANAEPPKQPYLPDPFAPAACVAMGTVDEQPVFSDVLENELICGFFNDHDEWPKAQPFLINLVPADPSRDTIARLERKSPLPPFVTMAEVSLKPGEIIKLKVSSAMAKLETGSIDTSNLEKMAFWKLGTTQGEKPTPQQAHRILCGEYSLYTPPRDVVLVHAVKKALNPQLIALAPVTRNPGDTALNIDIGVDLHRSSTGKVECEGKWEEPVDDVSQSVCTTKKSAALVAEQKIELSDPSTTIPNPQLPFRRRYDFKGLHNFGDTKHRNVTYAMRATTRFREYYPPAPTSTDPEKLALIQEKERDTYSTIFSDTTVNVLSTARPPAPNLAYVIPTFRWEQNVIKKTGSDSRRWGGGLRIYFERPWFASGEGERLGIVLYPGTLTGPLCKIMAPHITQWGRDPIWGLKPPTGSFPERKLSPFPGQSDFRWHNAQPEYQSGLVLEAFEKLKPADVGCTSGEQFEVAVVAFEPEFDQERGLWRCDIEMNPGTAYFPFVRLALARYQRHALDSKENDCRISSVVQAEFMQLTPDRWANLRYESDHVVNVTVSGYSYQSRRTVKEGQPVSATGVMKVAVEERCKNRKGDLRWQRLQMGTGPDGHIEPSSISNNQNGETIWNFEISLPRSRKVSRYRVVVLESEEIAQDKDHDHVEYKDGYRIVYADILGV
jgi:hypothetical protein